MHLSCSQLTTVALFGLVAVSSLALVGNTPSISTPVTELKYGPTGVSDGNHGELRAAPAYDDLAHGPHCTFIRMPAGFVSPIHTHTNDYWGVVISGVVVNGQSGSKDAPLPAGSYWFQKGGERHISKCILPNECLLFISQDVKFDYIPDSKT